MTAKNKRFLLNETAGIFVYSIGIQYLNATYMLVDRHCKHRHHDGYHAHELDEDVEGWS